LNRVGFDDPFGRTWRGFAAASCAIALVLASFGKNGSDQVRFGASPAGGAAAAVAPPSRIEIMGAVKSRSAPFPSTGHAAARPASAMARETSNSRPHARHRNP
jgi:hypothetical protein